MVKNDSIFIRCSPESREEFEKFLTEIKGVLRRTQEGRVCNEDAILYILEIWKKSPEVFKISRLGPQVR